jgi:hypothetical protein
MIRFLLMTACIAGGCAAEPAQEKGMKLELKTTTTTRKKGETVVTSTLRNAGSEPVNILMEFMLSRTSAKLTDEGGKVLEAHDASSVRGARMFKMGGIKTHPLKPGEEIEIEQFWMSADRRNATAGDLSWDLGDLKSKTLTLEMVYEVTEEAAKIAKQHKAPDVAVGRWTSKPVTLDYRN